MTWGETVLSPTVSPTVLERKWLALAPASLSKGLKVSAEATLEAFESERTAAMVAQQTALSLTTLSGKSSSKWRVMKSVSTLPAANWNKKGKAKQKIGKKGHYWLTG